MPTHLISLSPFYVTLQLVPFLFVLLFYSLFCLCSQNKTKQKTFKSHCHPSSDTKLWAPPVHLHFVGQSSVLFTAGCESWQLYQCLLLALPWDGGSGITIASAKQCPGVSDRGEKRKEKHKERTKWGGGRRRGDTAGVHYEAGQVPAIAAALSSTCTAVC